MKKLLTIGEVANLLRKPRYQISYLFENGILTEPQRVGNKRVFTLTEIEQIKAVFERRKSKKPA